MNTLNFMNRFEESGLQLYEMLRNQAADYELKELFTLLADEQKKHLAALEKMKENVKSEDADSFMLERACHLTNGFSRLLESHDVLHQLKNDQDAFCHIIKAEDEIIQLLEGVARTEPKADARKLIEQIVEDEKQHLSEIENIYEFIETPRTYLEWGEFSNLHPL